MSHVHVSFQTPEYVGNADGLGTLRILEAVRLLGLTDKTRIYQASTSELYSLVQQGCWGSLVIFQNLPFPAFPARLRGFLPCLLGLGLLSRL